MKTSFHGFTLSEILIAIAILGVCLSVSIPLLAQSREQSYKKAIFKETIKILYDVLREGMATDELQVGNQYQYFNSKLNTSLACPSASGDGCWDASARPTGQGSVPGGVAAGLVGEPGFVLPNGVTMAGFDNFIFATLTPDEWENDIIIDYNGKKGPNAIGQDQLVLLYCMGSITCDVLTPHSPGTIIPVTDQGPENVALFQEVSK